MDLTRPVIHKGVFLGTLGCGSMETTTITSNHNTSGETTFLATQHHFNFILFLSVLHSGCGFLQIDKSHPIHPRNDLGKKRKKVNI